MGAFDDVWRIIASRNLAVNSAGGAAASTTSLSAQTYAVDLVFPATVIATTGVRFAISDLGEAAITSTTGGFLPANTVRRYRVTPGQKVQAISHDASAVASLVIMELSK